MHFSPKKGVVAAVLCFAGLIPDAKATVSFTWSDTAQATGPLGTNPLPLAPQPIFNAGGWNSKPGVSVPYYFPSDNLAVLVTVRNMNKFGVYNDGRVWFEGGIRTDQSTLRMQFYDYSEPGGVGTGFEVGAPKTIDNIHFGLFDTDGSEWLRNFRVDTVGTAYEPDINNVAVTISGWTLLHFTDPTYFTWSGGAVLKDGDTSYASNGEPLEGGTQTGKDLDVLLGSGIYGFEYSLRRNNSSAGSMIMEFRAPEPGTALFTVLGAGLLLRRRRTA